MDAFDQSRSLPLSAPSKEDMDAVFQLCRQDRWDLVLHYLKRIPAIGFTQMIMDNHITTTVLHQAITSKGDTTWRAQVIRYVLAMTPQAAAVKNGYGSLPLHVISQRNTKMDAQTKESLIFELVEAYREGLTEEGGVGKRTPLHIIFTGTFAESESMRLYLLRTGLTNTSNTSARRLHLAAPHALDDTAGSQRLFQARQKRLPASSCCMQPTLFP